MRRLLQYADKLALVGCVLLFLASAVWAALRFQRLEEIAEVNPAMGIAAAKHEPSPVQLPTIAQVAWPEPTNQSRGSEWIYDVFTPPVLYYDPRTREFTVTRPNLNVAVAAPNETPFEVELISVRQEPYRIQLVGYAGNDTEYIAHFEIVDTRAVVLGRPGAVYPENKGDFTVRSFEVRRVTSSSHESMPVVESIGFATILDGRTGREVTLTTRERLMLPRLQCVLRTRVFPTEEHALREGMKITVNGYDYLIVQLSLNPAQAVVSRRPPNSLGGAETRTLVPVGDTAAAPRGGSAAGPRDNSIDSPRVSLFSSHRDKPLIERLRLPFP